MVRNDEVIRKTKKVDKVVSSRARGKKCSLFRNQQAHQAGTYIWFPSIFTPTWWDASPSWGYPSIKFAGNHLYTWVERGTVRVMCLAQEHNTVERREERLPKYVRYHEILFPYSVEPWFNEPLYNEFLITNGILRFSNNRIWWRNPNKLTISSRLFFYINQLKYKFIFRSTFTIFFLLFLIIWPQ